MTVLDVVYTTLWQRNDLFVELADNGRVSIWRGDRYGQQPVSMDKYESWWVRETLAGLEESRP